MTTKQEPFTLAVPVNHSDHFLGGHSPKVTLVEYGDFECPACGQAYPVVKLMLKHFGEKLRFVYRHFPQREVHPHAELAAEAAEAAGAQHKFWPMHDLLFENQLHLKAQSLRRYEIDFWGRIRHSVASARAQLEGSAYAVANLRLSLAAETARAYLLLRSDDRQILVIEQTLVLREAALSLAERRAKAGTINDVDVLRARSDLALTRADLEELRRSRELEVHGLAVLQNRYAPDFEIAPNAFDPVVPEVPAGLTSQLLERRPDVAQNERVVAAASEQIGIAVANFFPRIQITGSAGVVSKEFSTLFQSGSMIWSLAPALSLPLFDGGRNRSNFEAAQARYRAALAEYRKSTLVAFRETQDALSNVAYFRDRGAALRVAVENSAKAARVSRSRYDHGQIGYFEVVDSEREALNNQRAEIQNDQLRVIAALSLIKALGGGWKPGDAIPDTPREPAPGKMPSLPTAIGSP